MQKKPIDLSSDNKTTDAPMKASLRGEIKAALVRARALLQLTAKSSPADAQRGIYDVVTEIIEDKKRTEKSLLDDLAIDLGCLWGQSVCDALGWEWRVVNRGDDELHAVVSKDRAYFIAPLVYLRRQLDQRGKTADNTTLLLFNMLKTNKLPHSRPKEYLMLG
jgi:hypothetical protein